MPTTQQLRDAWNPVCQVKHRDKIVEAVKVLDNIFKRYNYRPKEGETWGYNCRKITGGSNYSLHSYRSDETFTFWTGVRVTIAIAIDINSRANPYGPNLVTDMPRAMVEEICAVRTNSGHQVWGWGGYYKNNKDAMHYELNCFPNQLATGIAPYPAQNIPQEEDMTQAEHDMLVDNHNRLANLEGAFGPLQDGVNEIKSKIDGFGGGGAVTLSDADIAKIATAVSDMLARRIVD